MADWTGERYLPSVAGATLHYEHLHRYRLVRDLVGARRVIDLACGEGYGSALLAETAAYVVGIDLDLLVVREAASRYRLPNLAFAAGSITALPLSTRARFEVAVAFEAIEHVREPPLVLDEARRVLAPGGLLILSTPDCEVYTDENPYHLHSFDRREFEQALRARFRHVRVLGQVVAAASQIFPLDASAGAAAATYRVARQGEEFRLDAPGRRTGRYLIGVASDAPLDDGATPGASYLVDTSDALDREQLALVDRMGEEIARKDRHIEDVRLHVRGLEEQIAQKEAHVQEVREYVRDLERVLEATRQQVEALQEERRRLEAALRAPGRGTGPT